MYEVHFWRLIIQNREENYIMKFLSKVGSREITYIILNF